LESGLTEFQERKTGLFIPYWLADRFSDWLVEQKGEKGLFLAYVFFEIRSVKMQEIDASKACLTSSVLVTKKYWY